MTAQILGDGAPDGTSVVKSSTEKASIFGGTPVARPASASQALVTESGSTTATACTILACTQSLAAANKTLLNELRNNLVSLDGIKGAA